MVEEFRSGNMYEDNQNRYIRYIGSEYTGSGRIQLSFLIVYPKPVQNEYGFTSTKTVVHIDYAKVNFFNVHEAVKVLYGESHD